MTRRSAERSAIDREVLRLALPALGALIAEPLFILSDTAMVGHLGPASLAGLGVASTILHTVVGLMVFLAYTTTPAVARLLGAGDRPGAIRAGIEGLWLGGGLGVVLAVAGLPAAAPLIGAFTADPAVTGEAMRYLLPSLAGLPAMLLVLAGTGLLRGLQDTRTPLVIATTGFAVNIACNALLIYGAGLGILGSAIGTVLAQWGMAIAYLVIAARAASRHGVSLRPGTGRRGGTLVAAAWMLLRTAALRAALVAIVWTGAQLGTAETAALQVLFAMNTLIAFMLDAIAIAAQAMIGHELGAGKTERVRAVTRRMRGWGVWCGAGLGALIALGSGVIGLAFTRDPEVLATLPAALLVLACAQPLAGWIFVVDGILIGAGDARYLALAGLVQLLALVPCLLALHVSGVQGAAGIAWLWASFSFAYMGVRAASLWLRLRNERWLVTGAHR